MKVSSGIRLKQLMLEKGLKQVDVINRSKHLQEELGIKLGKSTLSMSVTKYSNSKACLLTGFLCI